MPNHAVQRGDCISSIADQYGLTWQTVWNRPENSELRQRRKDPNVLYPGDIVFYPDLDPRIESCATDQRHKFATKDTPAKVKILLLDADKPRGGVHYELVIDGVSQSGSADGAGYVRASIPPHAQAGRLIVGEGSTKDVFEFVFGTVDPVDTDEGLRGRLTDLGYGTDNIAEALKAFQEQQKLPVTGEADAATRDKLKEKFGQ